MLINARVVLPYLFMLAVYLLSGQASSAQDRNADNQRRYVQGIMEQYDSDKDGELSQTELNSMRRPPSLKKLDLDNNDQVSSREYLAWLVNASPSRSSDSSSRSRSDAQSQRAPVEPSADANKSNKITWEIISVDHNSAEEMVEAIRSVYEAYGHLGPIVITAERSSNQIIVAGGSQAIDLVKDLANKLDVPARERRVGNRERGGRTQGSVALGGLAGQVLGSVPSSRPATRISKAPEKRVRVAMTLLRLPNDADPMQSLTLSRQIEGTTFDQAPEKIVELVRQHDLRIVDRAEFVVPENKQTVLTNGSTETVAVASSGNAKQYKSFNVGMQLEVESKVQEDTIQLDFRLSQSMIDIAESADGDAQEIRAPALLELTMNSSAFVKDNRSVVICSLSSGYHWLLVISARTD